MDARGLTRRRLVGGVLAALLQPHVARAQPERSARVGVLASSSDTNFGASVQVFREALRDAGWVEGRNLTLDVRYLGERQYARLPALAADLVRSKVDVIATLGSPATLAAKQATTTIPIVMESLADAVGTGLVTNLARPGGNVTGVSGFAPELSGKRLELIRELVPGAKKVAIFINRGNPATAPVMRATEAAARQMRLELLVVDVHRPSEIPTAFDTIVRERTDALLLAADPVLFSERAAIVRLAIRHRLPAVYETRLFAESGGLLSYGPSAQERFRRMAFYVDRILKGASPGDLPVEQPSRFELVLNLKAAKSLRLEIPPELRLRADHVIE
jgi:putative ABC transport system substrate-binding protein